MVEYTYSKHDAMEDPIKEIVPVPHTTKNAKNGFSLTFSEEYGLEHWRYMMTKKESNDHGNCLTAYQ
jgi:hypothetical protein